MLPKTRKKTELFNDGILSVWEVKEHTLVKEKTHNLRFGNKKITTMQRYYDQVAGERTDKLIIVPPNPFVSENDIIIIGGIQYRIAKKEVEISNQMEVLKISLEESKIKYKEVENGEV